MSALSAEPELRSLMEPVARRLLGDPNPHHSTKDILRWGANGSFAVDRQKGVWFDNEEKVGGGVVDFVMRQQLVTRPQAWAWLRQEYPDHFPVEPERKKAGGGRGRVEKTYDYRDAEGKLLFQVQRKADPKGFYQRRPGPDGEWIYDMKGVRAVPYRLPEVLAAIKAGKTVYCVEGEKDVDRLWSLGLAATCNPGGAGKWTLPLSPYLRGADVVVVGDHDPQATHSKTGELLWHKDGRPQLPGQDHAESVANQLRGVAMRVRLLRDLGEAWLDCPPKGDVSDFLDAGKTAADLEEIAAALPDYIGGEHPREPTDDPVITFIDDSVLAVAFALQNDDGRYDGEWHVWDEVCWREAGELDVLAALRTWLESDAKPAFAKRPVLQEQLGSNRKLVSIEHELRLVRRVRPDIWDRDPWLLNTPAGTWDLQGTPRLREHQRSDHLTKVTACSAGGDCPRWRQHIAFVTGGDEEYALYLQKLSGYALMGERPDQMFAFVYGSGGNGKGVFLQTITGVLGGYAVWSQAETFLESRYPRHSEELMVMRGARLVVASEVPEDAEWNTARLKQLTGGDKVRAHFMRKDSVEFPATALLLLAGNAKPTLKSIDAGVQRRLHLLPFVNAVKAADDIKGFAGQLVAQEGPGILAWMLGGCERVQADGLKPPAAVSGATEDYLEEEDYMTRWLGERCHVRPIDANFEPRTRIGILFEDWQRWAKRTRIDPGNINGFGDKLVRLGFDRHRTHGVRYVLGVQLRTPEEGDPT